jgi:uncharacterized membrane protein
MTDQPILYMDTELRPHRSMSKQGFAVIFGIMIAYNLTVGVFMLVIGAFPVPIFLGIDIVGVFIAFKVSNDRAKRSERVQVTHDEVRVIREAGAARQILWTSPTAFTRVEVDKDEEGVSGVRVRLSNRSLSIAVALGPAQRADFAAGLQAAIRSALAERHA